MGAAALLILLGSLLQNVAGTAYYSMVMQAYGTVSSPPVILEEGNCSGTSTIYANGTSAKVNVEAPLFDYVDNDDPDVDSIADKGMHSNFPAQQAGPDSLYDRLKEENTEGIEDYVDNNISDVDNSPDVGTHSNFENEKLKDGIYDTLTESLEEIIRDGVTQGQSTSATVTFSHTLGYSSGNNRLVIVAAGFENSAGDINIGSATYNGQSMTKIVQATTGGTGLVASVALFYLLDLSLPSSSGSYSVVVTAASNPSADLWACAVSYIGVKQEVPDDYDSDFSGSPTTMSSQLNCDEDGSMLVQACVVGNIGSFTPSSGTTEVIEDSDIYSASAVFNEKLGQDSGARDLGCTHISMNRGSWVGACWAPASADTGYDLDIEVQFTSVIDFLPIEKLCIYTGTLGNEDLKIDYWNGTGWENLATDLTAHSCNEYTVSLTSTTFTIRFKGGTAGGDTTQDQWQIDASLLRVEGAGSKEDAVDQQSNMDGSADVGTHSNFVAQQYGPDSIFDTLTEANANSQNGTFGYSGSVISYTSVSANQTYGSIFTSPSYAGTAQVYRFTWYGRTSSGTGGTKACLCDSNKNLLAVSNPNSSISTTAQWWTCTFGTPYTISPNTQYILMMIFNVTTRFYYTTGATNQGYLDTTNSYANPVSPTDATNNNNQYRVYASYTIAPNYKLDLEGQWSGIPCLLPNEELCIYGGTMGTEDIRVDVWDGTGWETVFTDLSSGWNNASITDWLTTSNFTIRFKGGTETGDSSQDTWQIDVALIHIWYEGGENYQLDLEVQWTSAVYTRTNEELCIKTGDGSWGAEGIKVYVWNATGSSWHLIFSDLTANSWHNFSVTDYLTSSTFTVRFLGGNETGDTTQDSWNIDATLLHVWTTETYDYVLQVVNQVNDNWTVNLQVYDSSNIARLSKTTISFHDGNSSNQITVNNGAITQSEGSSYNLAGNATIFISMSNLGATTTGTSYLYVHLKIRVPNTSTYILYVIIFEIT